MRRWVLGFLLAALGCGSSSVPSSFHDVSDGGADGSPDDGGPADAAPVTDAHLLIGDGATGALSCGQISCPSGYYCVLTTRGTTLLDDDCFPVGQCYDCSCVTTQAQANDCSEGTVTCVQQQSAFTATCTVPADGG